METNHPRWPRRRPPSRAEKVCRPGLNWQNRFVFAASLQPVTTIPKTFTSPKPIKATTWFARFDFPRGCLQVQQGIQMNLPRVFSTHIPVPYSLDPAQCDLRNGTIQPHFQPPAVDAMSFGIPILTETGLRTHEVRVPVHPSTSRFSFQKRMARDGRSTGARILTAKL